MALLGREAHGNGREGCGMGMKKQLEFVKMLFANLAEEMPIYIKNWETGGRWSTHNYMNRNHGKYVLKRKITLLRQELLNLEKMLDE